MSKIEIFNIIASMIGGLALFLFGMGAMSDSLSHLTGGVLEKTLKSITKNRYLAFLFGTIITAVLQSSSAVTVLTVGLVNSQLIELGQAVGLLVGANLGTTATAWLLSLNALDGESLLMTMIKPSSFSPFIAIIGVEIYALSRSDKKKNIGFAMLGFAVMMIGMSLMSKAVAPLGKLPEMQHMLMDFNNPILAFLFAVVFTMLIQSSDATVGIIQAFSLSVGVSYGLAIPLICGAQVGTCITALMSSLGASKNGKRTAIMNLYYNLLKVVPLFIIFTVLNSIYNFAFIDKNVGGIGIPLIHTLINVIAAAIFLPSSKLLVALVNRTIPLSEDELEEQANSLTMLDPILIASPKLAIEQADRAIGLMAETASEARRTLLDFKNNPNFEKRVHTLCTRIVKYRELIDAYLAEISEKKLSPSDASCIAFLSGASASFCRIGVTSGKVLDKFKEAVESGKEFTESEMSEIMLFAGAVSEICEITVAGYEKRTITLAAMIRLYREVITEMSDTVKKNHIIRMHESFGKQLNVTLSLDIYHLREQLIDDCDNIAEEMIRYLTSTGIEDISSAELDDDKRAQIKELFADKFNLLNIS